MPAVQIAPSSTLLQALSSLTGPKRAQAVQPATPAPRPAPPAKVESHGRAPEQTGPHRLGRIIDIKV